MSEKLITFVVPCYNSQDYMKICIDSLLSAGERAEILIVNDGSADRTAEIAAEYEADFPGICRVLSQENGGHGEGINHGLREASGKYLKWWIRMTGLTVRLSPECWILWKNVKRTEGLT